MQPGDRSCVQPPTSTTHGHIALLIDMGFAQNPPMNDTWSWDQVYKRQQAARASLLLLTGAPEKFPQQWTTEMGTLLHDWQCKTVNTDAYNLHCAWDPSIWSPPGQSAMIHLTLDFFAMSIQLVRSPSGASPPTADETFQLILTKLTGQMSLQDDYKECWRKLINAAISSQRWIITGDLAPFNTVVMALTRHKKTLPSDIGMSTNENGALTIVSCHMDLAVAHALGNAKSMVFKIPTTRSSVQPPVGEREEKAKRKKRDNEERQRRESEAREQ